MTEAESAVARALQTYAEAVRGKDVDAFVALYDDDVRVFDLWGRWSYEGQDAWRAMVADWFGSLGTETVRVEFDDVRTTAAPGLATCDGFVTYHGLSAEGQEPRALQNRITWTLAPRDGAWKIVHEHSSSPVDFETAKAIFKR